jgi:WD40 repeat protein
MALAVSPADSTVFTIGNDDGLVIHWDPADGHALETLAVTSDRFNGLAVSPDGNTLLIGETDKLIVWDVAGHKELRRIQGKNFRLDYSHVFSPDGRTFSSGLSVWDLASGRRLDAFRDNPVTKTWFTADGRRLISVEPDFVRIWDFRTGVEVGRPLQARLIGSFNSAVSPDGRLVATGNVSKETVPPDTQAARRS